MFKLRCSEIGGDCNFSISKESKKEIKEIFLQHLNDFHYDVFGKFLKEQKEDLLTLLDEILGDKAQKPL